MMFAFFKMFGGFTSFTANIVCAITNSSILDVIKDFVAV